MIHGVCMFHVEPIMGIGVVSRPQARDDDACVQQIDTLAAKMDRAVAKTLRR